MSIDPSKVELVNMNVVDVPKYIPTFVNIGYSKIPNAGLGIIANTRINKGTFLGNYMGEICDDANNLPKSDYIFTSKSRTKMFSLDGANCETSNYTRFINCSAIGNDNVAAIRHIDTTGGSIYVTKAGKKIDIDGYIFFFASRDIEPGEELLFDYGVSYRNKLGL
jgi:SET domain-containing protein